MTYAQPNPIEQRRESRCAVTWRGKVTLRPGVQVDVKIRDISESGVGFVSPEVIPSATLLSLTLEVPNPRDARAMFLVPVRFTAMNIVMVGHDYRVGATWMIESQVRELINYWVQKLRKGV